MNNSLPSSQKEKLELAGAISAATSPASSSAGGGAASAPSASSQPGRAELVKALKLDEIKRQLRRHQGLLGGWLAFQSEGKLVLLRAGEIAASEADRGTRKIVFSTWQDGVWEVAVPEGFDPQKIALGLILGELDWLPFVASPVASES